MDAHGFKWGIWLFWKDDEVDINVIDIDDQAITVKVRTLGSSAWYFTCDLDLFEERPDASNAWRGILNSKKLILKGSRMVIGNGKRTLFWYHKWCCKRPLYEVATSPPPQEVLDMTVSEIWDIFENFLPKNIANSVRPLFVTNDDEAQDVVGWMGDLNKFLVRNAPSLLRDGVPTSKSLT
ncbi:hypothetical protein Cgig2_020521 [Carnegiea gigantea]|uniref:Uncharacterized protein n=1 Tax=Carnegiea gigantea TaxID=171969 RepID=A0A9Q1KAY9_9CARY|nr:hypothetical protein Cgig2_020521 [Carnegiea gigantea]